MVVPRRKGSGGFTLAELLIVVAIIAVVSAGVIGLYNGVVKDSAETVSIATQKELTNTINSFFQTHNGRLADGLDSLLRDQDVRPYTGTYTEVTTGGLEIADDPKDAIYVGYDVVDNTTLAEPYDNEADPDAASRGLDDAAFLGAFRILTVAMLTDDDIETLNHLGITYVNDAPVRRLPLGAASGEQWFSATWRSASGRPCSWLTGVEKKAPDGQCPNLL